MQHPALELGHRAGRDALGLVETVQIAEEVAQRVAQPAIGFDDAPDDPGADPQVVRIVDRRHPETQDIGAVVLHDALRGDDVAERLGHLAPLAVERETVGQHRFVGRASAGAAGLEQRGVEPAPVLVGAFEIERRRPGLRRVALEHVGMRGAGVEPHVEDVARLFVVRGVATGTEEARRVRREPDVGAVFRHRVGDAVDRGGVAQRFAGPPVDEDGDGHPPGALARDAPVRAVFDHRAQALFPRRGVELRGLDGRERALAQPRRVHIDEPLRRVAEDHRLLRAPAVGVAVAVALAREQRARLAERRRDRRRSLVDMDAGEQGDIVDETPPVVDGRGRFQTVGAAELEIVGAVTGRHMHEARALCGIDETAGQEGDVETVALVRERMPRRRAGEPRAREGGEATEARDRRASADFVRALRGEGEPVARRRRGAFAGRRDLADHVFDIGPVGDGAVAGDRPGGGGPDDDRGAVERRFGGGDDGEAHEHRFGLDVAVFDFGFGESGLFDRRPHHRARAAIERAGGEELAHLAHDLRLGGVGHGEIAPVPVAENAEADELRHLRVDPAVGESAAAPAEFGDGDRIPVDPALAVLHLDLPFDRQPVTVPPRDVMGVAAAHLRDAVDHVLEDFVERVADVDGAVGVGRPVMQDELLAPRAGRAQAAPQVDVAPAFQEPGLAPRQPRLHRKRGARKEQRRFVIGGHREVIGCVTD